MNLQLTLHTGSWSNLRCAVKDCINIPEEAICVHVNTEEFYQRNIVPDTGPYMPISYTPCPIHFPEVVESLIQQGFSSKTMDIFPKEKIREWVIAEEGNRNPIRRK